MTAVSGIAPISTEIIALRNAIAPGIYLDLDTDGKVIGVQAKGDREKLLAGPVVIGSLFFDFVHADDRDAVALAIAGDRRDGETSGHVPFQFRSGERQWVLMQLADVVVADGISSLQVQVNDLAEARRSEAQLRRIVEGARHGIVVTGREGRPLYMNSGFGRLLGFSSLQALLTAPSHPTRYIHPDDFLMVAQRQNARSANVDAPAQYEFRMLRQDGAVIWVETMSSTINWQGEQASLAWLTDITARKQVEEALLKSEEMFVTVFQSSPDIMTLTTIDEGRYVDVNEAFLRLVRRERDAVIEATSADLGLFRKPDHRRRFYDHLVAEHGRTVLVTTPTHLGEKRDLEFRAQMITARGQELLLTIARDVTERRRHEEALKASKEAAEHANRIKSDFLANMSHEIRTPMNGVVGMTELLLKMPLGREERDYAETIRQSADALLNVINDILDISKLEAGKIDFESIDFNMGVLVDQAVGLLRPRAEHRRIGFGAEMDGASRGSFRGDPTRIRQVLLNLISNALKFTEKGGVTVKVTMTSAETGFLLRVTVTDTGIGMTEETCGRLFQKFSQADSSVTRRFGGTGLGLAISRQLVELMGGQIGVTSRLGEGSTFWFEMPLIAALNEVAAPAPSAVRPGVVRPLDVLLAEDNKINQKIVQAVLKPAGHRLTIVANGVQAVAAVRERDFDAVLMDVQMPQLDGPGATRQIRALPAPKNAIHVIALTADAMAGAKEQYLATGMDDYLTKPLDHTILLRKLAELSLRLAGPAAEAPAEPKTPEPKAVMPIASELPLEQAIAALPGRVVAVARHLAAGNRDQARHQVRNLIILADRIGAAPLASIARKIDAGCTDPEAKSWAAPVAELNAATLEAMAGTSILAGA